MWRRRDRQEKHQSVDLPGRDGRIVLGADTASQTIAAVASVFSPDTGAALVAVQPIVAEVLANVGRRGIDRIFGVAAEASGLSPEAVVQRLALSEDGQRLLIRGLEVAWTATYDEKLRVLGRCFAAGAEDGARIDQEVLIVNAVAVMEPAHMRLLGVVVQEHLRTLNGMSNMLADWMVNEPQQFDPALTPELTQVLVAVLESHGLVTLASIGSGNSYEASMLGRLLVARASESV